jgi:hypothetical protein
MHEPSQIFYVSQIPNLDLPADFPIDSDLRFLLDSRSLSILKEQIDYNSNETSELRKRFLTPNALDESAISTVKREAELATEIEGLKIFLHKIKYPNLDEGLGSTSPAALLIR